MSLQGGQAPRTGECALGARPSRVMGLGGYFRGGITISLTIFQDIPIFWKQRSRIPGSGGVRQLLWGQYARIKRQRRRAALVDYALLMSCCLMLSFSMARLGGAISGQLSMSAFALNGVSASSQSSGGPSGSSRYNSQGMDGGGTDEVVRCGENGCPPPDPGSQNAAQPGAL